VYAIISRAVNDWITMKPRCDHARRVSLILRAAL
jgi:hypothetical protein